MVFTSLVSLLLALGQPGAQTFLLPLEVGNEWNYRANVRWTEQVTNRVKMANILWLTRVVACRMSAEAHAAVVEGSPFELAWYSPDRRPGFSVWLENSAGIFVASASSREDAEALAEHTLADASQLQQLLRVPARVGTCLGEPPDRNDHRYCWLLYRRVSEWGAKGWELRYRANPDDQTVRLISGVGITRYEFNHHGTVASARVFLLAHKIPR